MSHLNLLHESLLDTYRITRRTIKELFELKSHSRQNIPLNHQKSASKRKSTIQTSMRKAKFVYQSFPLKIGSQQRKLTKVNIAKKKLISCWNHVKDYCVSKPYKCLEIVFVVSKPYNSQPSFEG